MSDRLAVMNHGRVEQAGTPREVYEEPGTEFVANFLGVSNLVDAEAEEAPGGGCLLRIGEQVLRAGRGATDARGAVKAMIRPERIGVAATGTAGSNHLPGMVEHAVFLGGSTELHVRIPGGALLRSSVPNDGSRPELVQGTPVALHLPPDAIRVLRTSVRVRS